MWICVISQNMSWYCSIIYVGVCSVVFLTKAKPCKLNKGAPPLSCSVPPLTQMELTCQREMEIWCICKIDLAVTLQPNHSLQLSIQQYKNIFHYLIPTPLIRKQEQSYYFILARGRTTKNVRSAIQIFSFKGPHWNSRRKKILLYPGCDKMWQECYRVLSKLCFFSVGKRSSWND